MKIIVTGSLGNTSKPRSQPEMGKVKLADFAKEFAEVYNKSN